MTTSTAADYDSEVYSGMSPQASSLATGTSSRPMSAAQRDLRGSRPNSAAIAAQIEGFDTDFLVRAFCCMAISSCCGCTLVVLNVLSVERFSLVA
jgi:hypothetical protein